MCGTPTIKLPCAAFGTSGHFVKKYLEKKQRNPDTRHDEMKDVQQASLLALESFVIQTKFVYFSGVALEIAFKLYHLLVFFCLTVSFSLIVSLYTSGIKYFFQNGHTQSTKSLSEKLNKLKIAFDNHDLIDCSNLIIISQKINYRQTKKKIIITRVLPNLRCKFV